MKKKLIIPLIFILCIGPFFLSSEQMDSSKLDLVVQKAAANYLKQNGTVSLVIGISLKGKNKIYGFKKQDSEFEKPDETMIFEIGSITKTFTGIVIQNLIQQGKLKLSSPLNDFLPETSRLSPVNNKEFLVRHLVSQSSGLPKMPGNHAKTVKDFRRPYRNYSMDHLMEFLRTYKPEIEPGSTYSYSNLNFALLGLIIEKITGESYQKVVERIIFKPLKMNNTFIDGRKDLNSRIVQGYFWGQAVPSWDFRIFKATGAIKSDLTDMLIYLNANMNAAPDNYFADLYRSHQPVFHEKTANFSVGLAWHIENIGSDTDKKEMVWHNGGTGGFRSFMGFVRSSKTGVVVLSNSVQSVDPVGFNLVKQLNNRVL